MSQVMVIKCCKKRDRRFGEAKNSYFKRSQFWVRDFECEDHLKSTSDVSTLVENWLITMISIWSFPQGFHALH